MPKSFGCVWGEGKKQTIQVDGGYFQNTRNGNKGGVQKESVGAGRSRGRVRGGRMRSVVGKPVGETADFYDRYNKES